METARNGKMKKNPREAVSVVMSRHTLWVVELYQAKTKKVKKQTVRPSEFTG
jgi:hypothetical protein